MRRKRTDSGSVTGRLFGATVDEILEVLGCDQRSAGRVYRMILQRMDEADDKPALRALKLCHSQEGSTPPPGAYRAARETLRWVEKNPPPKEEEKKPSDVPKDHVAYAMFRELLELITSKTQYTSSPSVDIEMAAAGFSRKGQIEIINSERRSCPKELYEAMIKFAAPDLGHTADTERPSIPKVDRYKVSEGKVAGFALQGMLQRYLEIDKYLTADDVDDILCRRGYCEEGALKRELRNKKKYHSAEVYDGLVKLVILDFSIAADPENPAEVPSQSELDGLRTPLDYDMAHTHSVGQIIELPKRFGVVIAKEWKDKIVVFLGLDRKGGLPETNPMTYRENQPYSHHHRKEESGFGDP